EVLLCWPSSIVATPGRKAFRPGNAHLAVCPWAREREPYPTDVITTSTNAKRMRVLACTTRSCREENDMKLRSILRSIASVAATLLGTSVVAGPVDLIQLDYGAATGALANVGRQTLRDGLDLYFGVEDYIANKDYSYQFVLPGSGENSESYIQFSPTNKS